MVRSFSSLRSYVTDFTWRRLGFVTGMILLTGSFVFVFELYTQTFRLNRLDREAALLERLITVEKSIQNSTDVNARATLDSLQ